MIELLKTLRDTPLPSLLVIGGLIFLLIPFIRGTKGTVEIETTNKGFATFLGAILLIGGVGLYIFPGLFSTPTTDIATETPSSIVVTATSNPVTLVKPTATSVSPLPTQQQSSGICQESGGASGFPLPPMPSAPTNGCVLIVEWWVPPNSANCGILITTNAPVIPEGSIGAWWYVYPQRSDSHKQEFLAKNPQCKVEDLR